MHCFYFITEEALAPSVLAFDEIVAGPFAAYLKCSKIIGGDVAQHADMAQQGLKYVVCLIFFFPIYHHRRFVQN